MSSPESEPHSYDASESSHPSAPQTRQQELASFDDLIPMTAEQDHLDVVTEVKPEVTATIVIPKERGADLADTIKTEFGTLPWLRYAEIDGELDITPTETQLRVTGTYFLTIHFNPDTVPDEDEPAVTAVEDAVAEVDFITGVEDITLRMPPYITHKY